MIKLENISKKFRYNEILDQVNCEFNDGSIYLIRGKNGTGKTVLLKLLLIISSINPVLFPAPDAPKQNLSIYRMPPLSVYFHYGIS